MSYLPKLSENCADKEFGSDRFCVPRDLKSSRADGKRNLEKHVDRENSQGFLMGWSRRGLS